MIFSWVLVSANPKNNVNPLSLRLSEVGPEEQFIEIISEANSMVPEVTEYHLIFVTRYHARTDTFIQAIVNLEGMVMQDDFLLTRAQEIEVPYQNVLKPGRGGNMLVKTKIEDFLKIKDWDMVMVILTFRLSREVDWREFMSEDNFQFTREA